MRVFISIGNRELSPNKVTCHVFVDGQLPLELSADEAAERMRDAWQRVVIPAQDSLLAIMTLEEA